MYFESVFRKYSILYLINKLSQAVSRATTYAQSFIVSIYHGMY